MNVSRAAAFAATGVAGILAGIFIGVAGMTSPVGNIEVEEHEPKMVFMQYVAEERHTYPMCGTVCSTDFTTDEVVVEDASGNEWVFYGVEDWEIGDICAMSMDDMGTAQVFDDQIIAVRYCGTEE